MIDKFRRTISSLFCGDEIKQWSPEKLAKVKDYLETKPAKDFTREDHYLSADYLLHRYFPNDEIITKTEWNKARLEIQRKIDRNIDYPNDVNNQQSPLEDQEFAEWLKINLGN